MIAFISGTVLQKNENSLYILTQGGVGYEVFVTSGLIEECDKDASLYIHMHVRENEISLYGFKNEKERSFFKKLLDIKGIGPKLAIEINSCSPDLLAQAFLNQDVNILTKIKGLGKKTAERIILELKNVNIPYLSEGNQTSLNTGVNLEETVEALASLGYERYAIYDSLKALPEELSETEEIVKWFLKQS